MMHMFRSLIIAVALCSSPTALAEQNEAPFGALFQTETRHWQNIDSGMSIDEYHDHSRQNLRVARKSAEKLMLQASSSLGIPEQGAALAGAALGLAVQGAKFNLNQSKTMALRLDEVAGDDRAISLRFRLDW